MESASSEFSVVHDGVLLWIEMSSPSADEREDCVVSEEKEENRECDSTSGLKKTPSRSY